MKPQVISLENEQISAGDALKTSDDSGRIMALTEAGKQAFLRGDFAVALEHFEAVAALGWRTRDNRCMATALLYHGLVLSYSGNRDTAQTDRAEQLIEQSLVLLRELDDATNMALALLHLSHVMNHRLDFVRAKSCLLESLAQARRGKDESGEIMALMYLGDTAMCRNDWSEAGLYFGCSFELAQARGHILGKAYALWGQSHVFRERAEWHQARETLCEASAIALSANHQWGIIFAIEAGALLCAAQERFAAFAQNIGAANAMREAIQFPLPPSYQAMYERYENAARAVLSPDEYEAAYCYGAVQSQEDALQYMLQTI